MSDWLAFLGAQGARVVDDVVEDFGDPGAELAAAASASVVADLSPFGVLRFAGADALPFLHGQVSNDVKGLGVAQARYAGYCTPKGRLLANFLLWREGDGVLMLLPRDLLAGVEKRLRMYVLRSKVTVSDATSEFAVLGVSGPAAGDAVSAALNVAAPAAILGVARSESGIAEIRVPGNRFIVAAPRSEAESVWARLSTVLRPAGAPVWQWLEIAHGLPLVTAPTQEELVPQMANLELVGGVSFDKGCYPGQEIVARSHYLGQVKRRTYRAGVVTTDPPHASEPVYAGGDATQTVGIVINAAPSPDGGYELLAALQTAAVERGDLHLRTPDGPPLRLLPLPYAIP
jgi:folate-binding protein YgfZ